MLAILLVIGLCSVASAAPDIDCDLYFLDSYTTSEDKTAEAQKIFPNCVRAALVHDAEVFAPTPIYVRLPYAEWKRVYNAKLYLQNKNGSFDCVFEKNNVPFLSERVYDVAKDSAYNLGPTKITLYAVLCVDVIDRTLPMLELKSQQYTDGSPLPSLASVEPYRAFSLGFDVKNFKEWTISGKTGGKITPSIALIDGNGAMSVSSFLAAGQNGIITIAAENTEGKRASFDIVLSADTSVPYFPVTGIKLKDTADSSAIPAGKISMTLSGDIAEKRKVEAILAPENATYKYVVWSSDKPEIASVDQVGTISALRVGTATITAETRDRGFKATCEVTVKKSASPTFTLAPSHQPFLIGERGEVNLESDKTWQNVTWSAQNPGIIQVWQTDSDSCYITGLKEGTTRLIVTGETYTFQKYTFTASCDITVKKADSYSINLYPESINIKVGEVDRDIKATYEPHGTLTGEYYLWNIDNSGLIKAETYGDGADHYDILRAFKAGEGIITVKLMSSEHRELASTSCDITVTDPDRFSIVLDPAALSLGVGEEKTTTASLKFASLPSYFVTWKIADSGTAMVVDSQNDYCIVRGLREGSTQLTATTTDPDGETLTATCDITVTDPADPSVTIDLSELGLYNDMMEVLEGDTIDLWISGTPSGLRFSAYSLPKGLTLSPQGHLYGTVLEQAKDDDSPRYYSVIVVANSFSGESGSESFTIKVRPQEDPTPDDEGDGGSDSGSGGCNAGFAGLTLSLAGVFCLRKRIGR